MNHLSTVSTRALCDGWDYIVFRPDGCCEWVGPYAGDGYPVWRKRYVHRLIYELVYGAIPIGYHVHHLCGLKSCVRPDHLQAMSRKEHARTHMGDVCSKGHVLAEDNVYKDPKRGWLRCRECKREYDRKRDRRKRHDNIAVCSVLPR